MLPSKKDGSVSPTDQANQCNAVDNFSQCRKKQKKKRKEEPANLNLVKSKSAMNRCTPHKEQSKATE